jgi:hypothetical protein
MRSQWLLASVCVGFASLTGAACAGGEDVGSGKQPKPGLDGGVTVGDSAVPVGDASIAPPVEAGGGSETSTIVGTGACAATPQPAVAPGGYYVVGPTICDSTGQPHLFHGVDRPSLEWSPFGQGSSGEGIPASDFTAMATWHANVVRVSLNQDLWLPGAALSSTGGSSAATYQATVAAVVRNAEAAGLDVILDLHWSDQGNLGVTTLGGTTQNIPGVSNQQQMADVNSMTFWQQVATAYMGDGHVLFELYNEPNTVTPGVWLNGGSAAASGVGFEVVGMQQLYTTVRTTGAQNLVLIGGLDWSYNLGEVLPSSAVTGTNIVYVTHPYSQKGSMDGWGAAFGNLAQLYPIMATEFGDNTCDATFETSIIQYFSGTNPTANPANPISWSAYAWWTSGNSASDCTFPTLLSAWPSTPSVTGQVAMTALLGYPAQP